MSQLLCNIPFRKNSSNKILIMLKYWIYIWSICYEILTKILFQHWKTFNEEPILQKYWFTIENIGFPLKILAIMWKYFLLILVWYWKKHKQPYVGQPNVNTGQGIISTWRKHNQYKQYWPNMVSLLGKQQILTNTFLRKLIVACNFKLKFAVFDQNYYVKI